MRGFNTLCSAVAGIALFASSVTADASSIDPIVIKGKHFFYQTNGSEFFIRGVAYQQDYSANASASANADYTDPLADFASCSRDIPYLVQLRTNVIRTYAINPELNHKPCMDALADAGIYVISDLSAPSLSINRDDPAWNTELYNRYIGVIDEMSQYKNVIGFFAGNEVSNSYNTTPASAFVKAAVRDSKAYISAQNYRTMYVGYATYDGDIRSQLADYFNCGDADAAIDFWGYNVYSWCGDSSYTASGYDERTAFFSNYSVPTFFAEYGCNTPSPRTFTEVQALYGPEMTSVWSGGIVYMYFQEINNFGLVSVVNSASVSLLPDFTYLSNQLASISPSSTAMSDYVTASLTAQACPTLDSSWMATATPLPPAPNANLCSCMAGTLDCVVSSSTDAEAYVDIFNYVCSTDSNACDEIIANGTTGVYGSYCGCSDEQKLNYVMNQYYVNLNSAATACSFSGSATLTSGASATGTCSSLLAEASGGTVASPTNKGTSTTSVGTGAATSGVTGAATSTTSATSTAAAPGDRVPSVELGLLHIGLYILGAAVTGIGMIVL